jgi:hypothetical protein
MNLRHHFPVFVLVAAALTLRYLTQSGHLASWWVNISPVMALCLIGGTLLPGASRWGVLAGLVAVDALVAGADLSDYLALLLLTYLMYALVIAWGAKLQWRVTGCGLLGRLLMASLGFYLVTNSMSWASSPAYAKTAGGWLQALTVGLPGYPPTWLFLRNSLISDFGFSVLLIIVHNFGQAAGNGGHRSIHPESIARVAWIKSVKEQAVRGNFSTDTRDSPA